MMVCAPEIQLELGNVSQTDVADGVPAMRVSHLNNTISEIPCIGFLNGSAASRALYCIVFTETALFKS